MTHNWALETLVSDSGIVFGSDRSPRCQDVVLACVCLCPGYYAQDGSKMVPEGPKERPYKRNIKRARPPPS